MTSEIKTRFDLPKKTPKQSVHCAFLLFFFFIFLFSGTTLAETGLPLPRFVSLRSKQVNLRTGPGFRYPVEWVYLKSDLPVEITAEFEAWRRIKDFDGKEGWIYLPMLSGRRTVRVKEDSLLLRAANQDALPLAKIESGAIGRLMLCPKDVNLCKAEFDHFQGWVFKNQLWGVYPDEVFE